MAPRYRTVERDQLRLLPHDPREWIPAGDIVDFIIEAATLVSLSNFLVSERGTGEEQYHPHRMLALLLYCYRFRKRSVEPVFGIVKQALGFRQFLLRGLDKVNMEWKLVACACKLKRLAVLW